MGTRTICRIPVSVSPMPNAEVKITILLLFITAFFVPFGIWQFCVALIGVASSWSSEPSDLIFQSFKSEMGTEVSKNIR